MLIQDGSFKGEMGGMPGTPQMMSRQADSAWAYCEEWSVSEKGSEGAN